MTCHSVASRIGGEFELTVGDLARGSSSELPGLASPHQLSTDTGRSALLLAAEDIRKRGGLSVVWLPAYCCESVAQPFLQAGFRPRYYPVGSSLHLDETELPQPSPGESLLFIHYFGHRNQLMVEHSARLRATGIRVIEDAAQAGLTKGIGVAGDYSITSYRKHLAQPDGALLGTGEPMDVELADPDESFVSAKMVGKLLRGAGTEADDFLPLIEWSEARLRDTIVPRQQSWLSGYLMSRQDIAGVEFLRRDNWQALHTQLGTAGLEQRLIPLFDHLDEGEVPLGLPVRVGGGQRDSLRHFLAEHAVFCPVHWALPHVPHDGFAAEHALAADLLTLPVDQRMTGAHITRLVNLLTTFFGEGQ